MSQKWSKFGENPYFSRPRRSRGGGRGLQSSPKMGGLLICGRSLILNLKCWL